MENIDKEQVYISFYNKSSYKPNMDIYVKDICKVYCKDKTIKEKLEKIKIIDTKAEETYEYISGSQIIEKILDKIDDIEISIIGATDILIEIKESKESNFLINFIKILLVSMILFFGAAIAIVNFFEDVQMKSSLEKINYLITGTQQDNPFIVTIPFSLGIGLGIFIFFNRILSFSKRRRQEPGPLELELYLYDKNLEDNIMNDLKKKSNS